MNILNWNNKNQIKKKSEFFHGSAIVKYACESLYGKFIDILKKTFNDNILDTLNIPKIIVIGAESSGKSSLLESIIKCPIFPRNSTICTKQPIHLILKTANNIEEINYSITYKNITTPTKKDDISENITKIMLETDIEKVSSEEILVTICELNLPNFEFYDLPGIRAYPQDIAEQTRNITETYLKKDNIIVVCVIPATTPRITSYYPISLIQKYQKEQNTIIALTMADRVQEDNIYELIVKRIEYTSDEFLNLNISGCVSVINRSHTDNISLIENDKNNEKFYKSIIDEIPMDYEQNLIIKIKDNIGIQNLIKKIDILYNNFIKSQWIPNTITNFELNLQNIKNDITHLGLSSNFINKNEISKINDLYNKYQKKIISNICLFNKDINNFNKRINLTTDINENNFDIIYVSLIVNSLIINYDNENFMPIFNENTYIIDNTYEMYDDDTNETYDIVLYDKIKNFSRIINFNNIILNGNITNEIFPCKINETELNKIDNMLYDIDKHMSNESLQSYIQNSFDNKNIYELDIENNFMYNVNRFTKLNKTIITKIINEYNKYIFKNLIKFKNIMEFNYIKDGHSLETMCEMYYNFLMQLSSKFNMCENVNEVEENSINAKTREKLLNDLIGVAKNINDLKNLKKTYS